MSSNMRELTDGELDSVGGGRHHLDRWTGGGSSGGGLTGFLGGTINIFINIGNTVGAEIGQQNKWPSWLNGAGVQLGS